MNAIVPLISSSVAGPLGVLHLPRLWLKASLEAHGRLAAGYAGCGKGFDQMVLDGLGLDREQFLFFIKTRSPTYPQLEEWIKEQPGACLAPSSIAALNRAILSYHHNETTRRAILCANGLADGPGLSEAITLNNLDDWKELHSRVLQ